MVALVEAILTFLLAGYPCSDRSLYLWTTKTSLHILHFQRLLKYKSFILDKLNHETVFLSEAFQKLLIISLGNKNGVLIRI